MKAQQNRINQFNKFFNHQGNFMTPRTLYFTQNEKYIAEISTGKGFSNDTIYGVTVLELTDTGVKRPYDSLGGCCHSKTEVNDILESIKLTPQTI